MYSEITSDISDIASRKELYAHEITDSDYIKTVTGTGAFMVRLGEGLHSMNALYLLLQ